MSIPHRERLEQEIREVFLNARFQPDPDSSDVLVSEVCTGYTLAILVGDDGLHIYLTEDWTCSVVHTECILKVASPDWGRFRRWLWEACYPVIHQVVRDICGALGVSVPWPNIVEKNGRRHFVGREPLEAIDSIFGMATLDKGSSHALVGHTGMGKTTICYQMALDAAAAGKQVLLASMEESTVSMTQRLVALGCHQIPPNLRLTHPGGTSVGAVFKQLEQQAAGNEVVFLNSSFVKFEDQLKRLAMKTGTEVFVTLTAHKETTEDTVLNTFPRRFQQTIDGVYWLQGPKTIKVLRHPNCAGIRYQRHPRPARRMAEDIFASCLADVEMAAGDGVKAGKTLLEIHVNGVDAHLFGFPPGTPMGAPYAFRVYGQAATVKGFCNPIILLGMVRLLWAEPIG
jgi:hypothetical protein